MKSIGCEEVNWIEPTQHKIQWTAFMMTVMSFRVHNMEFCDRLNTMDCTSRVKDLIRSQKKRVLGIIGCGM
jgi:hypothetical protein